MSRKSRGTSLIEVLVVIVVFLVGILAVMQVFPKGFQYLLMSRNASVATMLGKAESERLKVHSSEIPDMIEAVRYDGTSMSLDVERYLGDLGPTGDAVSPAGLLSLNGNGVGNWQLYSGANSFRRIVGETHRIPAPRPVGSEQGGLMLLTFGPIDYRPAIGADLQIFGNPLIKRNVDWTENTAREDSEYFMVNSPAGLTIRLSMGSTNRLYKVRFTAYVQAGAQWVRKEFSNLASIPVPSGTGLFDVAVANIPGVSPDVIGSIEPSSVEVRRQFIQVDNNDPFSNYAVDPYRYKLLDPQLGVVFFNPVAFSTRIGNEPLVAKVNYDVLDWRILREEFRVENGAPGVQLSVRSIKVGNMAGPDGLQNGGIPGIEGKTGDSALADNFVLVDMLTGGVFYETVGGKQVLHVDKSNGIVTVVGDSNKQALLRLPGGRGDLSVDIAGRPVRALYRANSEYSVQLMPAAANYTVSFLSPLATPLLPGQCYIGGGLDGTGPGVPTRVYFPRSDSGRKVVFGTLVVRVNNQITSLDAQDFVVSAPRANDPIQLPSIDISNVLSLGSSDRIANATDSGFPGFAAKSIKGASITVRVLWNPEKFMLGQTSTDNIRAVDKWGQSWRRSSIETFLQREALQ